jgi:hypothetical protein
MCRWRPSSDRHDCGKVLRRFTNDASTDLHAELFRCAHFRESCCEGSDDSTCGIDHADRIVDGMCDCKRCLSLEPGATGAATNRTSCNCTLGPSAKHICRRRRPIVAPIGPQPRRDPQGDRRHRRLRSAAERRTCRAVRHGWGVAAAAHRSESQGRRHSDLHDDGRVEVRTTTHRSDRHRRSACPAVADSRHRDGQVSQLIRSRNRRSSKAACHRERQVRAGS